MRRRGGEEGVGRAGHCPRIGEALQTRDGIRAAAVDDEGARATGGVVEDGFGDGDGGRLECVAGEARCGRGWTGGGREEDGEVEDGGVLFDAAVGAAEEVAAGEELVGDRFVEVRFGWGAFGGEGRRCGGETFPRRGLSHRDTPGAQKYRSRGL